MTPEIRRLVQV